MTDKLTLLELLEQAYVEGWRRGVEAYAVWKDGQQLVGMGRYCLSDAQKAAPEDAKPLFELWLEKQRAAFGRDEEPVGGH